MNVFQRRCRERFSRKGETESRFLAAQGDAFAGAKREEKASACFARNDRFGDCGVMSELKLRPPKSVLLEVQGGLGEVGGAAEVAPVVFVGAEGEDFFALGGEAEIRVDDGEDALFRHHTKEARGNHVDAGKGESVKGIRG